MSAPERRAARLALAISAAALVLVAALELATGSLVEALAILAAALAGAFAFAAEWPELQRAYAARHADEGALDRLDEVVALPEAR